METPTRPRPATRLTDHAALAHTPHAPVIRLLAAPVPEEMVLRACASDLTLTQQLVQLARLGAAALVANQAPGSSNPHGTHPGPSGSSLTTRETQVLSLVSNGHTVKQAADELGCTQSTANTHLSNVYRKLGVTDRTQAVLTARAGGII